MVIKSIIAGAYGSLSYLLVDSLPIGLSDGQWITFGLWFAVITFTAVIGIIIFKSVWLRDGYAGLNKILEDHEVGKFITHVLSFLCLLSLQTLIATQPLITYQYPEFLYFLMASGILGSGVYSLMDKYGLKEKIINIMASKEQKETPK